MALIILSKEIDLIYSPDDAANSGKGYYLQRYPSGETSQLFDTQAEAQRAFDNPKTIKWER